VIANYIQQQSRRIAAGELAAESILTAGKLLSIADLDANELAVWALACRVILNLDETITRE
jgi:hypothetical protein